MSEESDFTMSMGMFTDEQIIPAMGVLSSFKVSMAYGNFEDTEEKLHGCPAILMSVTSMFHSQGHEEQFATFLIQDSEMGADMLLNCLGLLIDADGMTAVAKVINEQMRRMTEEGKHPAIFDAKNELTGDPTESFNFGEKD